MPLKPGDAVKLVCQDNPRLHGTHAVVRSVTPWGAHVLAPAAAAGRFRAAFAEMQPVGEGVSAARLEGYTGEFCGQCGSSKMRRNGSCLLCENCGSTSGCS